VEKPRFFGSLETYRKYAGRNGFYIDWQAEPPAPPSPVLTIYGTIAGEAYVLTLDPAADRARFETEAAVIEIRLSDNQALGWETRGGAALAGVVDMLPYLKLKLLAESAGDPRRVHFANVAGLQEVIRESAL
jgi:hypothetical protein